MSATAGCKGPALRRSFRGRLCRDVRAAGRQVKRWRRVRFVPFLALAVLAGASGARAVETCEGAPDHVFGEFIGFALVCECAGTDPEETAALWDQTAAALCTPAFAVATRPYVQYVRDRPDMVQGRCVEICTVPLALTLASVARAIAGLPPPPDEPAAADPFVGLADVVGTIDPGLRARAAGREQEVVPRATSPDPADREAAAQTRLVETLCHLNPARPECRETD